MLLGELAVYRMQAERWRATLALRWSSDDEAWEVEELCGLDNTEPHEEAALLLEELRDRHAGLARIVGGRAQGDPG